MVASDLVLQQAGNTVIVPKPRYHGRLRRQPSLKRSPLAPPRYQTSP
jgi:hypothetical protein